jgi:hypothetical protein
METQEFYTGSIIRKSPMLETTQQNCGAFAQWNTIQQGHERVPKQTLLTKCQATKPGKQDLLSDCHLHKAQKSD